MFSPSEPCSSIRTFEQKIKEDLGYLQWAGWEPTQIEHEAEVAMLHMLRWELAQVVVDRTKRKRVTS